MKEELGRVCSFVGPPGLPDGPPLSWGGKRTPFGPTPMGVLGTPMEGSGPLPHESGREVTFVREGAVRLESERLPALRHRRVGRRSLSFMLIANAALSTAKASGSAGYDLKLDSVGRRYDGGFKACPTPEPPVGVGPNGVRLTTSPAP